MSPRTSPEKVRTDGRAARALLRVEREALAALRQTADEANRRLLFALVPLQGTQGTARRRLAEQTLSAIHRESVLLAQGITATTEKLRRASKEASLAELRREWLGIRKGIRRARLADPGDLLVQALLEPTDVAAAARAGQSFAARWSDGMAAATWRWAAANDGDLAGALAPVTADPALRRIAATDSAQAFSDLRDEGAGWLAERHGEALWLPAVVRVWDAVNDRKVCPTCAGLDGAWRPVGLAFEGAVEPGYVHFFCRCVPVWMLLPARIRRGETTPGRQVDDFNPRGPLEQPREPDFEKAA